MIQNGIVIVHRKLRWEDVFHNIDQTALIWSSIRDEEETWAKKNEQRKNTMTVEISSIDPFYYIFRRANKIAHRL